jgi:hypothetical protein
MASCIASLRLYRLLDSRQIKAAEVMRPGTLQQHRPAHRNGSFNQNEFGCPGDHSRQRRPSYLWAAVSTVAARIGARAVGLV